MIAIVDYGLGNLGSIQNMLYRAGIVSVIARDVQTIRSADKLILPGVGHFKYAMEALQENGLVGLLNERVLEACVPLLGICLGAQLLGRSSEEGQVEGLGWLDMETVAFDRARLSANDKVPHMGWSETKCAQRPIFANLETPTRFYYVHSFHFKCDRPDIAIATATNGYEFVSAVASGNIFGVQFHPEKSHVFGQKVLMNFARMDVP